MAVCEALLGLLQTKLPLAAGELYTLYLTAWRYHLELWQAAGSGSPNEIESLLLGVRSDLCFSFFRGNVSSILLNVKPTCYP